MHSVAGGRDVCGSSTNGGGDQIVVVNLAALPLSVAEEGLPLDDTQAIFDLLTSLDERVKVTAAKHDGHRVLTVSASPKNVGALSERRLKNNNICPGESH